MAPAPVTTRSISRVSDGTMTPSASITMGTRRTTPSRSGLIENSPRPAAASSIGATLRSSAGKVTRCGFGSPPSVAKPVCTFEVVFGVLRDEAEAGLPGDDARAGDRLAEQLIAARQLAQFRAGLVVEAAEALGRDVRRGPVRLGEHHVEGDGDAAERGQARDEIGHDRARPGPLADLLEARLVDVDDHDRPQRRLPRLERLVEVEAPEPQPFEQGRVPHPQDDEVEQQHEADGAAEAEPVQEV